MKRKLFFFILLFGLVVALAVFSSQREGVQEDTVVIWADNPRSDDDRRDKKFVEKYRAAVNRNRDAKPQARGPYLPANDEAMTTDASVVDNSLDAAFWDAFWENGKDWLEEYMSNQESDPQRQEFVRLTGDEYLASTFGNRSKILDVECTTTLCKIIFEHVSEEQREIFEKDLATEAPWSTNNYGFEISTTNGYSGDVIYFTKSRDALMPFEELNEMHL